MQNLSQSLKIKAVFEKGKGCALEDMGISDVELSTEFRAQDIEEVVENLLDDAGLDYVDFEASFELPIIEAAETGNLAPLQSALADAGLLDLGSEIVRAQEIEAVVEEVVEEAGLDYAEVEASLELPIAEAAETGNLEPLQSALEDVGVSDVDLSTEFSDTGLSGTLFTDVDIGSETEFEQLLEEVDTAYYRHDPILPGDAEFYELLDEVEEAWSRGMLAEERVEEESLTLEFMPGEEISVELSQDWPDFDFYFYGEDFPDELFDQTVIEEMVDSILEDVVEDAAESAAEETLEEGAGV